MNRRETLLVIAATLPEQFSVSDLVVAAWCAHPKLFGLKSHPYPNSNAVVPRVYGHGGLIQRGLLRLVEARKLEITASGRRILEALRQTR